MPLALPRAPAQGSRGSAPAGSHLGTSPPPAGLQRDGEESRAARRDRRRCPAATPAPPHSSSGATAALTAAESHRPRPASLRLDGHRGGAGSGAGPPQAGWKAPVAGRAVRGGALPAGRVGPPPASCPAARPSRPADRAAVARRAGLMRAGRDGGGRGPRRLQHRLRLAPLLHKPGFLISCVFCR